MTQALAKLLTVILIFGAFNLFADNTEGKLEESIETRIAKLTTALQQYKTFKKAVADKTGGEREVVLRKLVARMKSDTTSVKTAVSALDTYLDIKGTAESNNDELKRTKTDISTLKSEINSLKRNLTQSKDDPQSLLTI